MITVCLNKTEFEYDIHSLVKAFFPGEEVKVFADSEKIGRLEREQTPLFHMEIVYGEGKEEARYFPAGVMALSLYLPPEEPEAVSGEKSGLDRGAVTAWQCQNRWRQISQTGK